MITERPPLPYWEWLLQFDESRWGALPQFFITLVVVMVVAAILSLVLGSIVVGPWRAGDRAYRVVRGALQELWAISPRRIWALAKVAMHEAVRRRVLVAVAIFVLLLLFAGWFLETDREPAKLYFSFVLTATSYLGLLIALLLAVFSLPNDFKTKTIYTIVTKPVRPGDLILGRILGFTLVGTVLLAVMGASSYLFVARALSHTHTIASVDPLSETTSQAKGHTHALARTEEGEVIVSYEHDHDHQVQQLGERLGVSSPQSTMRARVPKLGTIRFLNRQGLEDAKGISVGKEWGYRSFVEGGSQMAAIWTFDGINESVLVAGEEGQYLPMELVVRVFRTHKGDITKPIQGTIQLKRPGSDLKTDYEYFGAKDSTIDTHYFPRQLTAGNQPVDLLKDLVDDQGRLEVVVQCLDSGQYFGFAQADCYLHLRDASPLWNFVKAHLGMWVQMVLVITIAVMCSTILSGPIAMLFTVSVILLGTFRDFLISVATDAQEGGGPLESLVRLVTQMNVVSDFKQQTLTVRLTRSVDDVLQQMMLYLSNVLPDFRQFNTAVYVARGFNIPADQVAQQLTVCIAYVVGLSMVSYFLFRTREVAR